MFVIPHLVIPTAKNMSLKISAILIELSKTKIWYNKQNEIKLTGCLTKKNITTLMQLLHAELG